MNLHCRAALLSAAAAALLLLSLPCFAQSDYGTAARAVAIEGGLVAVEAGIATDPTRPTLPFGKMKNPTFYFVVLANETAEKIWADVSVTLPGKKAWKDFGSMSASHYGYWRWQSLGAVFDAPISVHVSIYADDGRAKVLADKEMTMLFDAADKDRLFNVPPAPNGAVSIGVLSGWHEMSSEHCEFAGTEADGNLRLDICYRVWKLESVEHSNCEHPIVRAERLDAAASTLLAAQPEDFRSRADAFRAKGDLKLEKWTVKRCDAEVAYEVMMIKAPQGGTDFSVKLL